MRIKDGVFLMALSFIVGYVVVESKPAVRDPLAWGELPQVDTIKQDTIKQDTVISVKGKKALFIGDSHSAADYGWQHQVCKKTGMTYLNTAVGGKQTAWMLQEARAKVTPYFDYCFIYGGANDMASNRPPMNSVKNIQAIVNLCNKAHVTPIVITGFDPVTCINITASGHRKMALCIIDKLNLKIYENLSPKKKHQEKELRVIQNSKITIKQPMVEADK